MPSRPHLRFAALAFTTAACSAPPPAPGPVVLRTQFADQTPGVVPHDALDCVVVLYDEATHTLASAVVVGPDRLLTAAHVVEGLQRVAPDVVEVGVDGHPRRLSIEAVGDSDAPHGDWALLRCADAPWRSVAVVHEPARQDGWAPTAGDDVLLAGYAAGFFPDRHIDVTAPTPAVVAHFDPVQPDAPCWYATGDPLELGGMSGGAAMTWNPHTGRVELLGTVRGYTATTTRVVDETLLFGIVIDRDERFVPGVAFTIQRLPARLRDPAQESPPDTRPTPTSTDPESLPIAPALRAPAKESMR